MATREEIRKRLHADGIQFILVQFVDIHGAAKTKMMPVECYDEAIDIGAGFAGGAVWGAGQGPHSHDMLARIDPASYTPVSWLPATARFAADLHVDGEPHPFCPRAHLRSALEAARRQGYRFNVGMEPEHFLVSVGPDGKLAIWNPDCVDGLAKPCYDFRSMAPAVAYLQELTTCLNALGWGVYQTDHEDGNGQYEINFEYADALTTADRITYFRMTAAQLAKKHGAIATFMAKPFSRQSGSGMHVHFHVADAETGENLFDADHDPRDLGLSELAYHFLGGLIEHAGALTAVGSPTVNCYKRLQLGAGLHSTRSGYTWTPAFASYGDNNRTQMIRVAGPGHCEDRTVSAACNPYLALSAMLGAGLDGVKRRTDPGEPNLGNLYEWSLADIESKGIKILPQTLADALGELRADDVVRSALGSIAEPFLELKSREWESYHKEVSDWEIENYLTML
ncbi:MAG TPA: type III glutamate--ammonia ligase [Pirellulales bacterium]|nr:type III glutamate--ammonia ligase [Pirellulales bacterium]